MIANIPDISNHQLSTLRVEVLLYEKSRAPIEGIRECVYNCLEAILSGSTYRLNISEEQPLVFTKNDLPNSLAADVESITLFNNSDAQSTPTTTTTKSSDQPTSGHNSPNNYGSSNGSSTPRPSIAPAYSPPIIIQREISIYKLSNDEVADEDGDSQEEATPYQLWVMPNVQFKSLWNNKWFSESGKLVMKVFEKIRETAQDPDTLVVILIDEVESLTAARKAALSGAEPSDSIRVVNAFLTQLDRLATFPNILILTTSNLVEAVDVAFFDRIDIKQYIGPPSNKARHTILASGVKELITKKLIKPAERDLNASVPSSLFSGKVFEELVTLSEGFSGRSLRKIPFLAYASSKSNPNTTLDTFLTSIRTTICKEVENNKRFNKL
eukprot:gene17773-21201_t